MEKLIKTKKKELEKVNTDPDEIKIVAKAKWDNGVEVVTQSVKRKQVSELDKTFWDCYSLDEIKIGVTLNNKSEIEHIIQFLEIHKYCLKD